MILDDARLVGDVWGPYTAATDASLLDAAPIDGVIGRDVGDAPDTSGSDGELDAPPADAQDTADALDMRDTPDTSTEEPNPWGLTGPALAAGSDHVCAIVRPDDLTPGEVWCWGADDHGQLGPAQGRPSEGAPARVVGFDAGTRGGAVAITAGRGFMCALRADATVWCWGLNAAGQLGDGSRSRYLHTLIQVKGLGPAWGVSAGSAHACALLGQGQVMCWGDNDAGQLGDGGRSGSPSPQQVVGFARGASQVIASGQMTCALTPLNDGQVWCWGADSRLRDRPPSLTPTLWATGVAQASLGTDTLCVWDATSITPRCVGQHPQAIAGLSDGGAFTEPLTSPVEISRLDGAKALALAARTRCFLDRFGWPWCWGHNDAGQLGPERADASSLEPGQVLLPGRAHDLVITEGGTLCARDAQGVVWCWGSDAAGALGRGSALDFDPSPARVSLP